MKRILILLTLSVKSCVKSSDCSCSKVYLLECLKDCSDVSSVYFTNASYSNWDHLATFTNLTISKFYLNNNDFTTLEYNTIPDCLKKLKTLYLNINEIQSIPELAFVEMTSLADLNLASNVINYVDPNAFKMNAKLKVLNMNSNSITNLSFLEHTKNIKTLSLKNNRIEDLTMFYFHRFDALKELSLSRNRITHINPGFFENLPAIRDVYLDHNLIITIDSPIHVERSINLSYNQLICVNFTRALIVNLEENALICKFVDENENKFKTFTRSEDCTNKPEYDVCYPQRRDVFSVDPMHLTMIILAVIFCNSIICVVFYFTCKKVRCRKRKIQTNIVIPATRTTENNENIYQEIDELVQQSNDVLYDLLGR